MYEYLIGPTLASVTIGLTIQILILMIFNGLIQKSPAEKLIYILPGFISLAAGSVVAWYLSKKDLRTVALTFAILFVTFVILWFLFGPKPDPTPTLNSF